MRLVVAFDGSASAGIAVDLVAGIDWPAGTTIRVVEAIETGVALFGGPWPALAIDQAQTLETDLRQTAHESIEQVRTRLARPGLDVAAAPAETIISGLVHDDEELHEILSTIQSLGLHVVSMQQVAR